MKLPDKILHGDSYADIKRKINLIVDFVRAQQPVAGRGVRIRHYTSGTIFEASGSGARQSSAESYDGFFAVSLVRDENEASVIRIADGSDPESQTAGIAYVNGKVVEFHSIASVLYSAILLLDTATNFPPPKVISVKPIPSSISWSVTFHVIPSALYTIVRA